MRIAIDAWELEGRPTGVGRYLAEILREWEQLPAARAHEFVPLAPNARGSAFLWEQRTLPGLVREAKADVLFAPNYSGPLVGATPMVVTIHDVSFAAHPEWFHWREGLRRRLLTRWSAHRAARIITVSEFSRREIAEHLGVTRDRIDVIHSGITTRFNAGQGDRAATTPSVLFVGSIFNRRHIPALIDGFAGLARRHRSARLDIVGDNRTFPHQDIDRFRVRTGAEQQITLRSYVDDETLAGLYAQARAFVFLSEYEGFALPPSEALAAGVPVVLLDTPVAREVYGPAALYVARPEPALIERALDQALWDEAARAQVLAAAPEVMAQYSWRKSAEQTLDVLVKVGQVRR